MTKNVVLINPPWYFSHPRERILSQNLGLGYLAAVLVRDGHAVSVIDALAQGIDCAQKIAGRYGEYYQIGVPLRRIVEQIPPQTELVGITAPFTNNGPIVRNLAREIKKSFPRVPIVLGGVYPSLTPQAARCSEIDYYVIGEGELALRDLVNGRDPCQITGVYSSDPALPPRASAEVFQVLDEIPFPAREMFPMQVYLGQYSPRRRRSRTASLITSRGCPFRCRFCSIHAVTGFGWRARSAVNVLAEISLLIEKYNIEHIEIEDDNFTLEKQRTMAIVDGITRLNARGGNTVSWSLPNGVRVDTLDEALLRQIKNSNCVDLALAVESGDPHVLAKMNKQLDLQKVLDVAKICSRLGIPTSAFFMVGYPSETEGGFRKSMAFVKQLQGAGVGRFYATVSRAYPGTELFEECKAAGFLEEITDRENIFLANLITRENSIETPDFTQQDVLRRMSIFERATVPWFLRWYHAFHYVIKKFIPDAVIQIIKRLFVRDRV